MAVVGKLFMHSYIFILKLIKHNLMLFGFIITTVGLVYWCMTYSNCWRARVALGAVELGTALTQRIKARINVPPSRPTPGAVDPLLSFNLCGIKTSISLLNINVCWTLNTFEPAQRRRIKAVPFKGLFPPDHWAQSRAVCSIVVTL